MTFKLLFKTNLLHNTGNIRKSGKVLDQLLDALKSRQFGLLLETRRWLSTDLLLNSSLAQSLLFSGVTSVPGTVLVSSPKD
ncbi:hypothetical protein CY34DRAFT_809849 [Suillus luteus UH-Slu-Lm8-n1]|uniref:Unplaced genomic scaffold CY34scaffold_289, whole genome shotgun sequence n=1 Tax=Suillus luteus UH-Slu-Lm8-n1 TaxID=930992 RepID=A0A0D0A8G5_9AGAM|nr:hypothetical protein CY34DRAFT_809849 [Suillus luteus UH-Slu-Lm8-n1]